METMHMGTTWPEIVPFWACLPALVYVVRVSAIWQVLLDDASNTSLLSLSVTTRSTHHHVGSQFSASDVLYRLHPCTLTIENQSHAIGCRSHPSISGIGVAPI